MPVILTSLPGMNSWQLSQVVSAAKTTSNVRVADWQLRVASGRSMPYVPMTIVEKFCQRRRRDRQLGARACLSIGPAFHWCPRRDEVHDQLPDRRATDATFRYEVYKMWLQHLG